MDQHHFERDYNRFVELLKQAHPFDKAMSLAVGGDYDVVGQIERKLLVYVGLKPGMKLLDMGCGSGRLGSALSDFNLDYTGTDVVQDLLDYAKTKCPPNFKFLRHTDITIPAEPASLDFIAAFSVFTHLHHHESYIYLDEARKALRPGGHFVFSFLEFGHTAHWQVFLNTIAQFKGSGLPHLNQFIERNTIKIWAEHLGYEVVEIIDGSDAPWGGPALGQSAAVLRKPEI